MNLKQIARKFKKSDPSNLLKNTIWTILGLGLRIIIKAAYFIIIARLLGVQGYGAFVGIVSLVAVLSPIASLGSGNLLIKHIARDKQALSTSWGNALVVNLIMGTLLGGIIIGLAHTIFPETIPLTLIIYIVVSDLLFSSVLELSSQVFQGDKKMGWTAQLNVNLSLIRLAAALLLGYYYINPSPQQWGLFYFISSFLSATIGVTAVTYYYGYPQVSFRQIRRDLKEGAMFSFGSLAESSNSELDKTMLSNLASLQATGIYATACRLVDVVNVPIFSLVKASYSDFFQKGEHGINHVMQYAKKLIPVSLAYAAIAGIAMFLCAPILPMILGSEFSKAEDAVKWLAIIPILKTLNYFLTNVLTCTDHQKLRTFLQCIAMILNVILNYFLIVRYSWNGAAYSSIITNAFLSVSAYVVILYLAKRERLEKVNAWSQYP
ncbi:hypothetical protein ASG89_30070 [Paenibacillus sp. Soil766]|uniref:flippase n=1 Tax=Paenibacillus sp. Soil766 TaxID=1736404 RepID=UPI00070DFE8B|nr:flippase [Paenibacillus sp. Soil766]KRE97104.1 hypothetical protein ASG89_30070 [Paenibacillus sp. Soil766]